MDWFLYDNGHHHERVNIKWIFLFPEKDVKYQFTKTTSITLGWTSYINIIVIANWSSRFLKTTHENRNYFTNPKRAMKL